MSFSVRSFEDSVAALQATRPGAKLKRSKKKTDHYDAAEAVTFGKPGSWSDAPPRSTLYRMNSDSLRTVSSMEGPLNYASCFGGAIATFNRAVPRLPLPGGRRRRRAHPERKGLSRHRALHPLFERSP